MIFYHKKEYLTNFIEISMYCAHLNDFTTSYILYSVLQEEEKNDLQSFNQIIETKETIQTHWNELKTLFCVVKNNIAYRNTFQTISPSTPRIPLMTIWFQDMEMMNQVRTIDDVHHLLNFEKLKHYRELIESIILIKAHPYDIQEIESMQFFFSNI